MSATPPQTAAFGAWRSPITSALIVAQSISLGEARLDGDQVYWGEGRPQDNGRQTVVRRALAGGAALDVVATPFSVRTRVHEYGGGAWSVADGTLYFSNDQPGTEGLKPDRRLYRQGHHGMPVALTPEGDWRYADGILDRRRARWIGIREDHTRPPYPINTIVAVELLGGNEDPGQVLVSGHDFFSSPRLSPDGQKLAWLAWDHPDMPWVSTRLYVGQLDDAGRPSGSPTLVAGGPEESVFQPEWSPDGSSLCFVSDRSLWWNLYAYDLARGSTRALAPMAAEFGQAQWVFGLSTYAFADSDRIVATYTAGGFGQLGVLDLRSSRIAVFDLPFREFRSLRANSTHAAFCAGAPDIPTSVVLLDLGSGRHDILKRGTDIADDPAIRRYFTRAEPVEFPTEGGKTAFGIFYPPANPDYVASPDDKPPLVVRCHGGPTSAASRTLSLGIQFWTSRGIAVLDLDYGGSTGYGREYRQRLHLNWGVVDVDDAVNATRYLIDGGRVDARRVVIAGGSAGGYTALAALTFRDTFQGGASYYGVSDLAALTKDTHKFESRYLDWLIGPYPQAKATYDERSPLHHSERLSKPVIFLQGEEDAIVPPDQTDKMVEALRRKGIAVGYLLFSGEQHGFRRGANIQRALDAELSFYAFEIFDVRLSF
jgi:dipeptidyl aminopeptidase/acylaminoacyl peptidase